MIGICDEEFIRGKVPMTKREVRILTLTEAKISENSIILDIGAGTGSLSIEAAILAARGDVYAIEKNPVAVDLIKQNIEKFDVKNVKVLEETAPSGMDDLPIADAILIGGSGKNIIKILDKSIEKLKPNGRIVINTVTAENLNAALNFARERNLNYYANEIMITRYVKTASYHLKKSENPVSIIVVEKNN